MNTYRWIICTCLATVLSIGPATGTLADDEHSPIGEQINGRWVLDEELSVRLNGDTEVVEEFDGSFACTFTADPAVKAMLSEEAWEELKEMGVTDDKAIAGAGRLVVQLGPDGDEARDETLGYLLVEAPGRTWLVALDQLREQDDGSKQYGDLSETLDIQIVARPDGPGQPLMFLREGDEIIALKKAGGVETAMPQGLSDAIDTAVALLEADKPAVMLRTLWEPEQYAKWQRAGRVAEVLDDVRENPDELLALFRSMRWQPLNYVNEAKTAATLGDTELMWVLKNGRWHFTVFEAVAEPADVAPEIDRLEPEPKD